MRRPNPRDVTENVYDLAIEIAELLRRGRCEPTAVMQVRFDAERTDVGLALTYLQERGVRVTYDTRGRCWELKLEDVDWKRLRLGELVDLGLLPDDEQTLLELAVRSRRSNPQSVRDLVARLSF